MKQTWKNQPASSVVKRNPVFAQANPAREFVLAKDGLRVQRVLFVLDTSGSQRPHQEDNKEALCTTLREMVKKNESAEDVIFRVRLWTFNAEVQMRIPVDVTPEQALEMLENDWFTCYGPTCLSELYEKMDRAHTKKELFAEGIPGGHKGDPLPYVIILTDLKGTDAEGQRAASVAHLLSNQFYQKYAEKLCFFRGTEQEKAAAVQLVGGDAGKVIAVNESVQMAEYITPVFLKATLVNMDTYVSGGDGEENTGEVAEKVRENEEKGEDSARELTDEEINAAFADLFRL